MRNRDLSVGRQRLLSVMQQMNFGRIKGLHIKRGEPVFDPKPQLIREVKFGGDNAPRCESTQPDFLLKEQHRDLFQQLDQLADAVIDLIEVKHGLPFKMEIATA